MSRCTSRLSDSESNDNDDEILKLFASDEEVDASFSGFSQSVNINDPELDNPEAQILTAEDIRMAVTQKQQQTENSLMKENEPQVVASDDEFDYELPKIFEDDEKYDEEASPSLAKVFDNEWKENIIPDNLSRNFDDTSEWFPDPVAYATDAFSFSCHKLYPFIFPPFSQTSRVLQKIVDDQVSRAILIVPVWTTQLWYLKLLKALIDFPVKLPQLSNLLTLAHNNQSHTRTQEKCFSSPVLFQETSL
ncbi:unnamed protein product [Mytilus edulis]|uniref:Uncharacterized protein n=1 Tax=Mytilus edulis TaxID=6550 RepID=A0A8S3RBJ9_MYTED|nr:unnamed protein product [Mytilus edulis]